MIVVLAVEKGASEEPRDDWCLESNALKNVTTKLLCHFSRRIKISDRQHRTVGRKKKGSSIAMVVSPLHSGGFVEFHYKDKYSKKEKSFKIQ